MNRQSLLLALYLFSRLICVNAETASWMSGKWGVGLRTPAGGIAPPVISNYYVTYFNVTALVNQVKSMGASWLIVNLSGGASGDTYISYHPLLYELNPGSTPANITNGGRDLFGEIATALRAAGIACIAYAASEGPALLKTGVSKGYDISIGTPSVTNWANWVQAKYGNSNTTTLQIAYAKEIATYYANRYGDLVDGWWFDQSNYANIPLLKSIVKTANPNTVAMFNDGDHVPLYNSQPGLEDATAGTPIPLTKSMPNNYTNYPMITSVENASGWLKGPNGELALGHVFMPFGDSWNAIGTQNVWNQTQAVDWMGRVLRAGGAWTWNLPRQSNGPTLQPDTSLMTYQIVDFVNNVVAALPKSPTTPPTAFPTVKPSRQPTSAPSLSPTRGLTKKPTVSPTSGPSKLPTIQLTVQPTNAPSFSPTRFPSSYPTVVKPTDSPSGLPSQLPSTFPSQPPSSQPSQAIVPSVSPSSTPTTPLTTKPTSRPPHYGRTSHPSVLKPTDTPSASPSQHPSTLPSQLPTPLPSQLPSVLPSPLPSPQPSQTPSNFPTGAPSLSPSNFPSTLPSTKPTNRPTHYGRTSHPTVVKPTDTPSYSPSQLPTPRPTETPSNSPTGASSNPPTQFATSYPTKNPSLQPTNKPTTAPSKRIPTSSPTTKPSGKPTKSPTSKPTSKPVAVPTRKPSKEPTNRPTKAPTRQPTSRPTSSPTGKPTRKPTNFPTTKPTRKPTAFPTEKPTKAPTSKPTVSPTRQPTLKPTKSPTSKPTVAPTRQPTLKPTKFPTAKPTAKPSVSPTLKPTKQPTSLPTSPPTRKPTYKPTKAPSAKPTSKPVLQPTVKPITMAGASVANQGRVFTSAPIAEPSSQTCEETLNICGPNKVIYCHSRGRVHMTKCVAAQTLESKFGDDDYCGCCSQLDTGFVALPDYCDALGN